MKSKVLLISFLISLPFFWLMNALADNLEDFWFQQELAKKPELFTADISRGIWERKIQKIRLKREQQEHFKNLDIAAQAGISVFVDTTGREKMLFEKNLNQILPIASLTKLMTALVILDLDETYSPSQTIKISKKAVDQEGESKYGDLRVGERLSVENLIWKMLIESSNDSAFVLTQPVGEKAFVGLMNIYAKNLKLKNTHFINSTGLDPDNKKETTNYSTIQDIVKLTKYIQNNYPQIFEITKSQQYRVLKPDGTLHHFIAQNTNKLLDKVPGIMGGKTGWTFRAGGCLLLVVDNPRAEGYFINIVLGAEDRFQEMEKILQALNIPNTI